MKSLLFGNTYEIQEVYQFYLSFVRALHTMVFPHVALTSD